MGIKPTLAEVEHDERVAVDLHGEFARLFAENPHSARGAAELEDRLEKLNLEVDLYSTYLVGARTEIGMAAEDAMFEMCARSAEFLDEIWSRPRVRETARRALQGVHERYIGPIDPARTYDVVFSVGRLHRNRDFSAYIEAWRAEARAHWVSSEDSAIGQSLRAVIGPLWVHDLYRYLGGDDLIGEPLRARYGHSERMSAFSDVATLLEPHLGEPVLLGDAEVLETALRLWSPDEPSSPYQSLGAAVRAAGLL